MLLAEYAPASVIIDDAMHVLQVRGRTDRYLQVPQGAPTTHLTPMVRPGLLAGLKSAIEQAVNRIARERERTAHKRERQFPHGRRAGIADSGLARRGSLFPRTV